MSDKGGLSFTQPAFVALLFSTDTHSKLEASCTLKYDHKVGQIVNFESSLADLGTDTFLTSRTMQAQ